MKKVIISILIFTALSLAQRTEPITITLPYDVPVLSSSIVQRSAYTGNGFEIFTSGGWNDNGYFRLYPPSSMDEYLGPGWLEFASTPVLSVRTLLRAYWNFTGTGCRVDDIKFMGLWGPSRKRSMLCIDDFNNSSSYGQFLTIGAAEGAAPVYFPSIVGGTDYWSPQQGDPLAYGVNVPRNEWICIEFLADVPNGVVKAYAWTQDGRISGVISEQEIAASGSWNNLDAVYFNDAVNFQANGGYFDICLWRLDTGFQGPPPGFVGGTPPPVNGYRSDVDSYRVKVYSAGSIVEIVDIPNSSGIWSGMIASLGHAFSLAPGTYSLTVHEIIDAEEGICIEPFSFIIPQEIPAQQTIPIRIINVSVDGNQIIIEFENEGQ